MLQSALAIVLWRMPDIPKRIHSVLLLLPRRDVAAVLQACPERVANALTIFTNVLNATTVAGAASEQRSGFRLQTSTRT
jgi:hypothetical protein